MSTIPSVLAPVITSFTPTKIYPSFTSIINQYYVPVTFTNAGANTITAAQVIGGFITHTAAGAETDTLPTATLLVQAIQGATDQYFQTQTPNSTAGSGIRFFVRAGGTGTITVAVGTGGTLDSLSTNTVATGQVKEFLLIFTKVGDQSGVGATYTLYSLGTSTE
jgi:hypothetical protein